VPAYSQGSTVSFKGFALGSLLGWDVTPAAASTTDCTSVDSVLLGSGIEARIVKNVDCCAVDPGTASVTFLGGNGFSSNNVGEVGFLVIDSDAGTLELEAILQSFQVTAAVGELIKGTATFQFTGQ